MRRSSTAAALAVLVALALGGSACDEVGGKTQPLFRPGAADAAGGSGDGVPATDPRCQRDRYPSEPFGVAVGDVIGDLEFRSIDGEPWRLSDARTDPSREVLFINTAAEWCSACIEEQPSLRALYERLGDAGLEIAVTVFQDDEFGAADESHAAAWKERFDLPFVVVADPNFVTSAYYDAAQTPMNLVIDLGTMEILHISTGENLDQVEAVVRSVLDAPAVECDDDGGGAAGDGFPPGPYGTAVGAILADLEFTTSDGGTLALSDIRDRDGATVLFVNTAAEWCSACIEEQPSVQALYERASDRGLEVLVTVFQDSEFAPAGATHAATWRERFGLTFDVVADPTFVWAAYYDAANTPMNLVVDLQTMEILHISTGENLDAVEAVAGPLLR